MKIEVLRIRIQYLNGDNVIKTVPVPTENKVFESTEDLEENRKIRETELQYKLDKKFMKENPSATDEDLKHRPRVSVLYDTRSVDFYVQPSLYKKSK